MLAGAAVSAHAQAAVPKARIAITLDLEMSRNFPRWEVTHWDYEKGNLDDAAKSYSLGVARRVKAAGGRLHFFCVARVLEQENVDWLAEIAAMGHAIGNHTYDHVNVLARRPEEIQFRFQRAPWLIGRQTVEDVIAANIALAHQAIKTRLGIEPAGFRTPGGFAHGLRGHAGVQRILAAQGYTWVSAQYTRHPLDGDPKVYLPPALERSQPFRYEETRLVEIPMSPISDINAFRGGKWPLERFLAATRVAVEWAIEKRAVLDLLAHPSCLGIVDPDYRTVDMICSMVRRAPDRAELVDLVDIAATVA
jgi:peptidoglycan/xylan/chitin deacetylase (PgdA/CDA1 family)